MIITDKLKSYSAARAEVMPSVEHLQQKYQNNGAENSHQPTRLRERDETVQVSRSRSALPLTVRNHLLTFPSGETSVQSQRLPSSDESEIRGVEGGDLRRADHQLIGDERTHLVLVADFVSS